jgi:hypothetical protein
VFLLHCESRDIARPARILTRSRVVACDAHALFPLAKRAKLRSKLIRRLSMQRDRREAPTKSVVVLKSELKQLKRF